MYPDLGHALFAIAYQPQVAVHNIRLRAFLSELRLQILQGAGIATQNLQRHNAPLHVCPRAGELLNLHALAIQHGDVGDQKRLVRCAGAGPQHEVVIGAPLRRPHGIGIDSVDGWRSRFAVLLQSSPHPEQGRAETRQGRAVRFGKERQDSRQPQRGGAIVHHQPAPRPAVPVFPGERRTLRVAGVLLYVEIDADVVGRRLLVDAQIQGRCDILHAAVRLEGLPRPGGLVGMVLELKIVEAQHLLGMKRAELPGVSEAQIAEHRRRGHHVLEGIRGTRPGLPRHRLREPVAAAGQTESHPQGGLVVHGHGFHVDGHGEIQDLRHVQVELRGFQIGRYRQGRPQASIPVLPETQVCQWRRRDRRGGGPPRDGCLVLRRVSARYIHPRLRSGLAQQFGIGQVERRTRLRLLAEGIERLGYIQFEAVGVRLVRLETTDRQDEVHLRLRRRRRILGPARPIRRDEVHPPVGDAKPIGNPERHRTERVGARGIRDRRRHLAKRRIVGIGNGHHRALYRLAGFVVYVPAQVRRGGRRLRSRLKYAGCREPGRQLRRSLAEGRGSRRRRCRRRIGCRQRKSGRQRLVHRGAELEAFHLGQRIQRILRQRVQEPPAQPIPGGTVDRRRLRRRAVGFEGDGSAARQPNRAVQVGACRILAALRQRQESAPDLPVPILPRDVQLLGAAVRQLELHAELHIARQRQNRAVSQVDDVRRRLQLVHRERLDRLARQKIGRVVDVFVPSRPQAEDLRDLSRHDTGGRLRLEDHLLRAARRRRRGHGGAGGRVAVRGAVGKLEHQRRPRGLRRIDAQPEQIEECQLVLVRRLVQTLQQGADVSRRDGPQCRAGALVGGQPLADIAGTPRQQLGVDLAVVATVQDDGGLGDHDADPSPR